MQMWMEVYREDKKSMCIVTVRMQLEAIIGGKGLDQKQHI